MGYATTVMKQRGPSHAVGDKIIEARAALSRTSQCTRADGKGVLQSYKNKFHVPLTSPTSLEMLKTPTRGLDLAAQIVKPPGSQRKETVMTKHNEIVLEPTTRAFIDALAAQG